MKKVLSLVMALVLTLSVFTACGNKTAATTPAETTAAAVATVEGTMEELLNQIVTENPVEFMGGVIPVDLTDTSEDGLWAVKSYTGLEDAASLTEAAAFEPMMGSIAFSMVLVRVAPEADTKAVAEAMKSGIDTRKWICVEANDLLVAGIGDVVMLIMLDSESGLTAQSFVDAFAKVAGAEPSFTI